MLGCILPNPGRSGMVSARGDQGKQIAGMFIERRERPTPRHFLSRLFPGDRGRASWPAGATIAAVKPPRFD